MFRAAFAVSRALVPAAAFRGRLPERRAGRGSPLPRYGHAIQAREPLDAAGAAAPAGAGRQSALAALARAALAGADPVGLVVLDDVIGQVRAILSRGGHHARRQACPPVEVPPTAKATATRSACQFWRRQFEAARPAAALLRVATTSPISWRHASCTTSRTACGVSPYCRLARREGGCDAASWRRARPLLGTSLVELAADLAASAFEAAFDAIAEVQRAPRFDAASEIGRFNEAAGRRDRRRRRRAGRAGHRRTAGRR